MESELQKAVSNVMADAKATDDSTEEPKNDFLCTWFQNLR